MRQILPVLHRAVGVAFIAASFFLATTSVFALRHAPFVSWIPDQRVFSLTAPMFQQQYFRVIDYDSPTGVSFSATSSLPGVFDATNVKVVPCVQGVDTGCTGINDGTGYRVWFNNVAAGSVGATTITLKATGNNNGASTYPPLLCAGRIPVRFLPR